VQEGNKHPVIRLAAIPHTATRHTAAQHTIIQRIRVQVNSVFRINNMTTADLVDERFYELGNGFIHHVEERET